MSFFNIQVEKFKLNQNPKNALHSKFHVHTGDPIFKDDEYEHLQVIELFFVVYIAIIVQFVFFIFAIKTTFHMGFV